MTDKRNTRRDGNTSGPRAAADDGLGALTKQIDAAREALDETIANLHEKRSATTDEATRAALTAEMNRLSAERSRLGGVRLGAILDSAAVKQALANLQGITKALADEARKIKQAAEVTAAVATIIGHVGKVIQIATGLAGGALIAAVESPAVARPRGMMITGVTSAMVLCLDPQADAKGFTDAKLKTAGISDFEDGSVPDNLDGADLLLFPRFQIAIAVVRDPDRMRAALGGQVDRGAVVAHRPERIYYTEAPKLDGTAQHYVTGYRDAITDLTGRLLENGGGAAAPGAASERFAEAEATWGLQVTGTLSSRHTGNGVRIAVLDTGADLNHPDLAGRIAGSQSFVTGLSVQDDHGHGTHCLGTAGGPRAPASGPRYGVAPEADLYVARVLDSRGYGKDRQILSGLNWALDQGCDIASLSLSGELRPETDTWLDYERVGRVALESGMLIVAAAGNESRRPRSIAPVGAPANCLSIMAIAALDDALGIAEFSNGQRHRHPGAVIDLAAPGVDVLSAWPSPLLHCRLDGTSMATPHVAGIAALWAETDPGLRGRALFDRLLATARRIPGAPADVGAGLVQAP